MRRLRPQEGSKASRRRIFLCAALACATAAWSAGCGGDTGGHARDATASLDATGLPGSDAHSPDGAPPPGPCEAGTGGLSLHANIETLGVTVSAAGLPATADLFYRRAGEAAWRQGHPVMHIDDGRLAGSLFWLQADTPYEVRVTGAGVDTCGEITTQPEELTFAPQRTLHVDVNAPAGGDGSAAEPFQSIQEAVDSAGPGDRVLVADGLYREEVTLSSGGTPGQWLQVIAAGAGAVLDGSETLTGAWIPHPTEPGVWSIDIGQGCGYLARDGQRFYRYNDMAGLLAGLGDDGVPMDEGWVVDGSVLWVRSQGDPAGHTWNVPRHDHGFVLQGADWVWIEGFEIRFFGQGEYGSGVYVRNASHTVVRGNSIHGVADGIVVRWTGEGSCDDARIEDNEIFDPPVADWEWDAVKGTSHEGSAIVLGGTRGAVVRRNDIHDIFNGIYTGRWGDPENVAIAFDVDVYDNFVHHIGDDGFEPEGACINHRFWRNTYEGGLVGISLAPITHGPVWILRNTFAAFTGTSFKWSNDGDGPVLVYHNTAWTREPDQNGMGYSGLAHNVTFRNNIVSATRYAFESTRTGMTGHDYDYDNWHSTRGAPLVKWEDVRYDTLADLCAAAGMECHGAEHDPVLLDPEGGDLSLGAGSPNVDQGVVLPGINDGYLGAAPDRGFAERE